MSQVDSPSAENCFAITNFRELMRGILQDDLNKDELITFHWSLMLPPRLMEGNCPAIDILCYLEHSWTTDPAPIIDALQESLHRVDLAKKIEEWKALAFAEENHSQPEVHMVEQETDNCLGEMCDDYSKHGIFGSVRQRGRVIRGEITEACEDDVIIPVGHLPAFRTASNASTASSGYHSHRGSKLSQRFSELSFISTDQHQLGDSGIFDNSLEMSGKSFHLKETSKVSSGVVSPLTKTNRPDSPLPTKSHSVHNFEREPLNLDDPGEFRPRLNQIQKSKVQKKSSVTSEGSDSSYSSQQSGSSVDISNGSGNQDSSKANSLRRIHVVSSTKISGSISIDTRKILDDIRKKKSEPRVSIPFPSSKDMQYQFRLFPINNSKSACELHINIARDYLESLKSKGTSGVTVRVPEIAVTVATSVSSPVVRPRENKMFDRVYPSITEITNVKEYLKNEQNFVRVTSFSNVIKWEELYKFERVDQAKLDINVELDVFS